MTRKPLLVEYGMREPFLTLDLIFISMSVSFRFATVTRYYMRVVFNCIFVEISNLKLERLLHLAYLYVQQ